MPVGAQPADEFKRCRREALEQRVDQRQGLPGFLEFRLLLGQTFFPTQKFGGVCHALLLMPVLQEQQQVVDARHTALLLHESDLARPVHSADRNL